MQFTTLALAECGISMTEEQELVPSTGREGEDRASQVIHHLHPGRCC